jgi:hypothetical protein
MPLLFFRMDSVVHILKPSLHRILNWIINMRATPTEDMRNKTKRGMKTASRGLSHKPNDSPLLSSCRLLQWVSSGRRRNFSGVMCCMLYAVDTVAGNVTCSFSYVYLLIDLWLN